MRAFLRRWRWRLVAAGFLLAVFVAVLFMARDADDGSKAPWEMVQPGMTWEQVGEILARSPPYPTQQSAFFDKSYWYRECVYRHYVLRIRFDKDRARVTSKIRVPRASWWEKLLIDLRRLRSTIGI